MEHLLKMRAEVINVIGPYDGPYESGLMTYKLKLKTGDIIAWHENGKRGFPEVSKNTMIFGLKLNKDQTRPDYKKSQVKELCKQIDLFKMK